MQLLEITRDRFEVVHQDISEGSEPALRFYLLVGVSTLIAGFGLISNSTAVVIGAMLVAPLMTPIFGISLALVRGETKLFGRAIRAEVVGVAAAVGMSFILGLLLGDFEPTDEMLSRTRPTLFDLLVAVLAGFAGAYALVDEKISPALPGVAIATAIVPPLANSGLCLALGEVAAGLGSFLLFFANFLSILVVASLTFVLSGMAKRFGVREKGVQIFNRFRLPLITFILIAAFLGHSLFKIAQERRIARSVRATLIEETSKIPSTILNKVNFYFADEEDRIHVVASVNTPATLTPTQVSRLQNRLTEEIGKPTELIMQCVLSSNVSAQGSVRNTFTQNFDGTFTKSSDNEVLQTIAMTEQIIREHLADDISLNLSRVEYIPYGDQKAMLAYIVGIREMTLGELRDLEAKIRVNTGESTIRLVTVKSEKTLWTTDGPFRYGWIPGNKSNQKTRERFRQILAEIQAFFDRDNAYDLVSTNVTILDDKVHFLLEITGPEVYPRQQIDQLKERLTQKFSEPIILYAWSRIDIVHGPDGPLSMKKLSAYFSSRQRENLPDERLNLPGASSR